MFTKWFRLEQRRYRSRHLIPMFIGTPCIMPRLDTLYSFCNPPPSPYTYIFLRGFLKISYKIPSGWQHDTGRKEGLKFLHHLFPVQYFRPTQYVKHLGLLKTRIQVNMCTWKVVISVCSLYVRSYLMNPLADLPQILIGGTRENHGNVLNWFWDFKVKWVYFCREK